MMGWGSHGYGMFGGGGFGGIAMVLFWGLIIVGIVLVIRYFTTGQVPGRKDSSPYEVHSEPLQLLRQRSAKGEIDTEEFEERKKRLESGQ
jgi:putative membrane protein